MSTPAPKVSVCIPAYNVEKYVCETLDSVLAQTFKDFEIIFVDDGSVDRTLAIAEDYSKRDSRIRVFAQGENKGLIENRNRTLKEARGDLIALADSDDIMHPDRLARQVSFMDNNPEVGALGSTVDYKIEYDGRSPHQDIYPDDSSIRFFMNLLPCLWNPTTMYRRNLIEQVGGYRSEFAAGGEDYELWSRLLPITQFANILEPLVTYRVHGSSVMATQPKCLNNVLSVSKSLFNQYTGLSLTDEDRMLLHRFMTHEGLPLDLVKQAFHYLETFSSIAKQREPNTVYSTFQNTLSEIYLTHSEYISYVCPSTSGALLLKSLSAKPTLLSTVRFWKQAVRGLVLNRIRKPK
ncbi:glycosyltransferase family 2 protein [Cerasicoccus frondis]|uniref:glycosyltransferase family 2 protein n=1 Tax=Cerasicoccus frondis TaxID=490090 RepID=UPI002852B1E9|nr:glycosyltransferase family 2 protein [Cerasicoccus frondis]